MVKNKFMAKLKVEKVLTIRAYCTECGKLLLESNPLSKKELMNVWDKAVFDAPGIPCVDCDTKIPNFRIRLMIYNSGSKLEFNPQTILPKPLAPVKDIGELLGFSK